jgi:hypothetical protein
VPFWAIRLDAEHESRTLTISVLSPAASAIRIKLSESLFNKLTDARRAYKFIYYHHNAALNFLLCYLNMIGVQRKAMIAEMATPRSVWTSDNGSMAQETAKSRWPKLVQGMIDDVRVTGAELAPSRALDDIRSIEISLGRLKDEITGDCRLRWVILIELVWLLYH